MSLKDRTVHEHKCIKCQKMYALVYDDRDYKNWREEGLVIQRALPYLSADEHELLNSGVCGECFDKIFG